jgi:hypothetical protein
MRMALALDNEYLRMQNEWFFKWHQIGSENTAEIDGFNGRMIRYGGIDFFGTPRIVYWETIQRYLRQKIATVFDALELELKTYPVDTRYRALNEARMSIKVFASKIRRAAVEKDRILRGNGFEFPEPQDLGRWAETGPNDIDMRADELIRIYCDLETAQKDGYMLDHLLNDRVTLVKSDGEVRRSDIPSLVSRGSIQIHDSTIPIEVGDHLLRELPNGLVEDYVVDDPVLQAGIGSVKPFYIVHVSRSNRPAAQANVAIQNITNNFHGSNSRVNINSTDQSTNLSSNIGIESVKSFLDQVKASASALPAATAAEIAPDIALLEAELRSETPSQERISSALSSIKNVVEGAAGNLVASGIGALATALLIP